VYVGSYARALSVFDREPEAPYARVRSSGAEVADDERA
jgi:hypothetical protein